LSNRQRIDKRRKRSLALWGLLVVSTIIPSSFIVTAQELDAYQLPIYSEAQARSKINVADRSEEGLATSQREQKPTINLPIYSNYAATNVPKG